MTDELMSEIKVPRTDGSIITVVGVGGAGGNAVNHMWNLGLSIFVQLNAKSQLIFFVRIGLKPRVNSCVLV